MNTMCAASPNIPASRLALVSTLAARLRGKSLGRRRAPHSTARLSDYMLADLGLTPVGPVRDSRRYLAEDSLGIAFD
ncbi:hypothetical protein [Aurantimonas sp. VKM B-3413]|uniref:hypothetical protein n=1 Tax=Aurantimonas sp. VKM B-3413 TaxID=2779401 RepID=UPI001E45BEE1|nr:hypothetical protein [Aurantimonas sp. VKM B-3413]MCB8836735.1 hypothetical protein [Aurantimonas sp. VKM B-3413]